MSALIGEIPKTMKACRVVQLGQPVQIVDLPVKKPGHGQVLVKISVSGVCHTDVHMRDGDLTWKPPVPLTLGHEGVGKVFALGPGTSCLQLGDRVCCPCLCSACGSCSDCVQGWETACDKFLLAGCHVDGTFAQFLLANEKYLCKVPDGVTDEEAAPINCAGVTTYKALKVTEARAGQWVVIIGAAGGLGYYAIQFAKAMGLKVIAVDRGQEKKDYLKETFGVVALDSAEGQISEKIMKTTGGHGAHAVVNLVPIASVGAEALTYLRKRGVLVVVGLPPDKMTFDPILIIEKMLTIRGSLVGTRADLQEALTLVADGWIKSSPKMRDFSEINDILDDLASGKSTGRSVVRIPQ